MHSLVVQDKIAGGVTLMARKGQVVHLQAVGKADREVGDDMRTDTIFRIASMTKPVTSVAVMILVEEGKIDLDDPVSKFIPEFRNPRVLVSGQTNQSELAQSEITIKHLLTHSSGLVYSFDELLGPTYLQHGVEIGLSRTEMLLSENMKRLAKCPLLFHPGQRFQYGMSTDVLGCVVERASGMRLDEFIENRICGPLKMTDTNFRVPPEKQSRLAAAYIPVGPTIRKVKEGELVRHESDWVEVWTSSDYCLREKSNYLSGGAGLCSTSMDYFRFCQMLLNGGELDNVRILRPETVNLITRNHLDQDSEFEFGLGFEIVPVDARNRHPRLKGSYSWSGYWSTFFRIAPKGEWIHISLTQLAYDVKLTPAWGHTYDDLAAKAILE